MNQLNPTDKLLQDLISQAVETKGLSWDQDVDDVIPGYDYMQVLLTSGIIDSWNFAIAVQVSRSSVKVSSTILFPCKVYKTLKIAKIEAALNIHSFVGPSHSRASCSR